MNALDPAISTIIAAGVALLFAAAALHKLADWPRFRAALEGYRIVPAWLAPIAASGLVALEVYGCGSARTPAHAACRRIPRRHAARPRTRSQSAINLLRGRTSIDCGCLGAGGRSRIGRWMVRAEPGPRGGNAWCSAADDGAQSSPPSTW